MTQVKKWGRRVFLVGAATVIGGAGFGAFIVNRRLSEQRDFRFQPEGSVGFSAWLAINPTGAVQVSVPHQEMGQGILSFAAVAVADELGLPLTSVQGVQAPIHGAYANTVMLLDGLPFAPDDKGVVRQSTVWTLEKILQALGVQATGGSTSTRNIYEAVRTAAASARASLIAQAALKLNLNEDQAKNLDWQGDGLVHADGRRVALKDILSAAANAPIAGIPKPKAQQKYIGQEFARSDLQSRVNGQLVYGVDVRQPNQVYAAIAHCPVFGGTLKSAKFSGGLPGVLKTVTQPGFVAVIANSWWQAKQALAAAQIEWDEGVNADLSDSSIFANQTAALQLREGKAYEKIGEPAKLISATGANLVDATYRVPYLAHATMEPMNCTVKYESGKMHIWSGNQAPTLVKWMGAQAAGIDSDLVEVTTLPMGGGFGRRAEVDVIREAVLIAKALPGQPVQTIWSREEDIQHDTYRPSASARMRAVLDANGMISAASFHIASPSVTAQFTERIGPMYKSQMPDKTNVEGALHLPYGIGTREVLHSLVESPVPVGFWRSVGHSFNAFFVESFIDECAIKAGKDPLAYRLGLLARSPSDPTAKRFARLLEAVKASSQWGREGATLGVAIAESFKSIVALVVEVKYESKGKFGVPKIWAAVDCGQCLDPMNARAQVRGAIHFGLNAAIAGRIDIKDGRVVQSNFSDYPIARFGQSPEIRVEFLESDAPIGGIGEIGTPPVAPALCNALFAATKKRVGQLPVSDQI